MDPKSSTTLGKSPFVEQV